MFGQEALLNGRHATNTIAVGVKGRAGNIGQR